MKETGRKGAICIDAVGYEAVGHTAGNIVSNEGNNTFSIKPSSDKLSHAHSQVTLPAYQPVNPLQVITWMCEVAKKYSTVSILGVYGSGYDQFPLGLLFNRNVSINMGQCPVKKYSEQLFHLIETKRIDPTKVISHTMKLDDAPKGYANFDKKEDVMKIVLKPQQ